MAQRSDDDPQRSKLQEVAKSILNDLADEVGFAIIDTRQRVVEQGFFGERTTPHYDQQWDRGDDSQADIHGNRDGRDDLYGNDHEPDRDHEQEIDR